MKSNDRFGINRQKTAIVVQYDFNTYRNNRCRQVHHLVLAGIYTIGRLCLSDFLFHDIPEKQSIAYDISPPHPPRLLQQPVQPLQAMSLPP